MRYLFASFVLSLLLSVGTSLPAAAEAVRGSLVRGISVGSADRIGAPASGPCQLQRSLR